MLLFTFLSCVVIAIDCKATIVAYGTHLAVSST